MFKKLIAAVVLAAAVLAAFVVLYKPGEGGVAPGPESPTMPFGA